MATHTQIGKSQHCGFGTRQKKQATECNFARSALLKPAKMKRSREPEEASPEEPPSAIPGGTIPSENDNSKGDSKSVRNDDREMSQPAAKITELDPSANSNGIQMSCSLPPHKDPVIFSSYDEYETHYRDQHTNRCLVCRKNFPSAYLLGLHIEETHDSFAMVRRERGERTVSPWQTRPAKTQPPVTRLTARPT